MFCKNCGSELSEQAKFCHKCGGSILDNQEKISINKQEHFEAVVESKEHDHVFCERQNKKFNRIGLIWLIAPTITIFVILTIYAITNFVLMQISNSTGVNSEMYTTIGSIIRVFLGLVGIFAVLGIMIGIPVGILYLNKRSSCSGRYDARSGKGADSEIPKEILDLGWNWGASGLSILWGLSSGVWRVLWMFIPIVNIFFVIYLGMNGNKLAWRANKWESVEKFIEVQNKWKPWGILFFVLFVINLLGSMASS
jgi:hypothetical protein